MYLVNDIGLERKKFEKINALKIFFLGYPIVGFVWFLIYLGHSDDKNGKAFFFIVMLPFMIGLLSLFIFGTFRTMKRWNKTIEQICVENDNIKATSFSILWMKSMEYTFSINEVKIKKSIFEWYGKEKKEGIIITIEKDINIYIVKEYFDEYERIYESLFEDSFKQ